jgi:hypothetical protein
MRRPSLVIRRPSAPVLAAAFAVVLIALGGVFLLQPHLRGGRNLVADVPAPRAFFAITRFVVPPHERACMGSVAIDANSDSAQFGLAAARPGKGGDPPVDLVLLAPGYRGVVKVPRGTPSGVVTLPVHPRPTRSELGTACFVDVGRRPAALYGTTETRTVARSRTLIAGRSVAGDIALTFFDDRERPLWQEIDTTFGHASNLTDGLVPVWLIWIVALLVLFAVALGPAAALYFALRDDEAAGRENGRGAPA